MPKSNKIKRQEKIKKEFERQQKANLLLRSFAARREQEQARIEKAMKSLNEGVKNPKEALNALYKGQKITIPTSSPIFGYRNVFDNILVPEERKAIYDLILHCVNEGCEFFDTYGSRFYSNAIKGIGYLYDFWLRPLKDWKPPSHNTRKQMSSLVRHLFTKYHVPVFMDDAFYSGNQLHQDWFLHVGAGQNIRTAYNLPIPLTKKSAHLMMEAPNDFDVTSAIRWGQVRAMGGDERLIRAILGTRIRNLFVDNEFWESVFRWFMDNPMLDTNQYAPLIDYIHHQKFIPSIPNPELRGPALIPAQPHLSMKKRSVDATIKAMELWHRQTGRANKSGDKVWNCTGIPEFYHEEGESDKKIYTIVELLTTRELKEEGNALCHCAGSYSHSCASGMKSIWSMRLRYQGTNERMLTIEVDNSSRNITQARGKFNGKPTSKANDIMRRWGYSSGLALSRWMI